jgi:hypothetical protein
MFLDQNKIEGSDAKINKELSAVPKAETPPGFSAENDTPERATPLEKILESHDSVREEILQRAEAMEISATQDALADNPKPEGQTSPTEMPHSASLHARTLENLINHSGNLRDNSDGKVHNLQEDANEITADNKS